MWMKRPIDVVPEIHCLLHFLSSIQFHSHLLFSFFPGNKTHKRNLKNKNRGRKGKRKESEGALIRSR